MQSHMTGILLVNLGLVGVVFILIDIMTGVEAEMTLKNRKVGCHIIAVLSAIANSELNLLLVLIGLDRILELIQKPFYNTCISYVTVSCTTWIFSVVTTIIGTYLITGGVSAIVSSTDYQLETECWLVFDKANGHLKYGFFFWFMNMIIPALAFSLTIVTLSAVWYKRHKSGYTTNQNDKWQNIAFLVSALLLTMVYLYRSLTRDSNWYANLSVWWFLVHPSIVILWLSLVPELRKALACCVCIMNESEAAMLLDE